MGAILGNGKFAFAAAHGIIIAMLDKRKSYTVRRTDRATYARAIGVDSTGDRRVVSCKQEKRGYVVTAGAVDAHGEYRRYYDAAVYPDFLAAAQYCNTLIAGISGAF